MTTTATAATIAELGAEIARRLVEHPDQFPDGRPFDYSYQQDTTDEVRATLIGLNQAGFATSEWQLGKLGGNPYSSHASVFVVRAAVTGLADTSVRDRLAAFTAEHSDAIRMHANPIKHRRWHRTRPGVPTGAVNGRPAREFATQIDRRRLAAIAPGADPEQTWTVALVERDLGTSETFWNLLADLAA
jgi:hypothetical protein